MVTTSSSEGIEIFEDLKTYCSHAEWNQLADAERISYNNIMKNHLFTSSTDSMSVSPDIMGRGKTSEDVNEEKVDERSPSLSGGHIETVMVHPGNDDTEQTQTADHSYSQPPPRTDATEQVVPEGHNYCDQCKLFSSEKCKVHGPPVSMALEATADGIPPYASEMSQSGVQYGGLEISEASVRTDIGPCEGVKTDRDVAIQSGYPWVDSEEKNNCIAREETQPYDMSYVNCANNETGQNMAYQIIGQTEVFLLSRGDEYPMIFSDDTPQWDSSSAEGLAPQSYPSKVFSCPECTNSYTSQDYLYKHMKSRHNDLYFQMLKNEQIPQSAQKSTSSVTRQKQQGSPYYWLLTDEAGAYAPQLFTSTLLQPEVKTENPEKKNFHCKHCDRSFLQQGDLNRHRRIHTGEKPYRCTECEKSFSQLSNLRRHEDLHTGERRFHCKQCGRSFSLMGHLKTHLRTHTGEKPYRCRHCYKCFSQSGDLKKHQRAHTGEKPFHCKQCDKSFHRLDTLKTHQRIHTGEKPFPCRQCDKSFSQLANLKSHERLHTGEKPYRCTLCDRSFSQLGVLNRHQRRERARGMA